MKTLKQLKQAIVTRFSCYKGKIGTDLAMSIVEQEFDSSEKELASFLGELDYRIAECHHSKDYERSITLLENWFKEKKKEMAGIE